MEVNGTPSWAAEEKVEEDLTDESEMLAGIFGRG